MLRFYKNEEIREQLNENFERTKSEEEVIAF